MATIVASTLAAAHAEALFKRPPHARFRDGYEAGEAVTVLTDGGAVAELNGDARWTLVSEGLVVATPTA